MSTDDEANTLWLDTARTSRGAIREFVVEFLGGLIPGVAFLLALIPAFVLPVIAATGLLFPAFQWTAPTPSTAGPTSMGLLLLLVVPVLLMFLAFAYIAGHLFYRQDPKDADRASFMRIPRHINHDGMVRAVAGGDIPVEFPYHFLKQYLEDRGIDYLAAHVRWGPGDFKRRAKHFANALKIRILIESPQSYGILARNEGHIRLSSSMWYVCRVLLWSATIGLAVYFAALIGTRLADVQPAVAADPTFVLPLLVLAFSWLGKWAIERALHYQREREILFILETAHWLAISGKATKIFAGLEPPGPNANDDPA